MKLLLLSVFGMGMAMSASGPTLTNNIEKELEQLKTAMEAHGDLMKDLLGEGAALAMSDSDPAVEAAAEEPKTGLRVSKLVGASLQPASGLHSGARGLTSDEEWRRTFPHPVGYSR
jgi:hypothetical protein